MKYIYIYIYYQTNCVYSLGLSKGNGSVSIVAKNKYKSKYDTPIDYTSTLIFDDISEV